MSSRYRAGGLLTLTFVVAAVVVGPIVRNVARAATSAPPSPVTTLRCFGAASRDPAHHCFNPALRRIVYPTPTDAVLESNSPCIRTHDRKPLAPCLFGAAPAVAQGEIALVGDSHAAHWRAAVSVVANLHGWHGTSITRASCPFTRAAVDLPERTRVNCRRWNAETKAWFERHPEVHTVLVSNNARFPVSAPPRTSHVAARAAGYMAAWRALPATVTRILVIRDTPVRRLRTLDCVEHQIALHGAAGIRCAVPRRSVLHQDAATVAVRRIATRRVHTIDLTRYFCSPRRCLPVIGGALVNKDGSHITTVFAESLAPYLMHRLDAQISPETAAAPGLRDQRTQRLPLTSLPEVHGIGERALDLVLGNRFRAGGRDDVHLDRRSEVRGGDGDGVGDRLVGDHLRLLDRQLRRLGVDQRPHRELGEDVAAPDRGVALVELVVAAGAGQREDARALRVAPAEQACKLGWLGAGDRHEVADRRLLEWDHDRGQVPAQLAWLAGRSVQQRQPRLETLL
jgi:hypothetical protein